MELVGGEQGWSSQHDSWQQTVNLALGYMSRVIDIYKFKRIAVPYEKRLVIAAPDAMDRRALLGAIKDQRLPIHAWVHLTPEVNKNKATVYSRIQKTDTKIEDRGDEIILYWRKDTHV